ncbi:rhamnogalacturonan acetylesterase [Flindersiella endophytica]
MRTAAVVALVAVVTAASAALTGTAPAAAARSAELGPTATGPTIYIASDSTAQTYSSAYEPQAGWGQMLNRYFTSDVTVTNRAIGGRSSRTFIQEGRLATILSQIQPGDYLFVQFGHNDASINIPERYTSPADYKEYLRNDYIRGARAKGAIPVIVTPVSRLSYNTSTGQFNVSFPEYVNAAIAVAQEENAKLIDLSASSRAYLNSIGPDYAKEVFLHTDPGEYPNRPDGTADNTHFQKYGALQMARLVARGVSGLGVPLSGYVRDTVSDVYDFGPAGTPVASSYQAVTATTTYSSARGYGLIGTGIIERDRGTALNGIQRDFVALFNGQYEFRAQVPAGAYQVRVYAGDATGTARTNVALEGSVTGRLAPSSNTASWRDFTVTVGDGVLNLVVSGETGHLNGLDILPAA